MRPEGNRVMRSRETAAFATVAFLALALGAGCTNEKIVYRSGTDFSSPPLSAVSSASPRAESP